MAIKMLDYATFMQRLGEAPWPVIDLIVLGDKGLWLALREATEKDVSYDRMWSLPGGFLLKGETVFECYQRILLKELGLDIFDPDLPRLETINLVYNNPREVRGHLLHIPLVLDLRGSMISLQETQKARFFGFRDFKKLPKPMIPHHIQIIRQYLEEELTLKNLTQKWLRTKWWFNLTIYLTRRMFKLVRKLWAPPAKNSMTWQEVAMLFEPQS